MSILISPTISTISINGHAYTHEDWENNTPGVIGNLGNDLASKFALLESVGTLTLPISFDTNLTGDQAANLIFIFTGTLAADAFINFPIAFEGIAIIDNQTVGGYELNCGIITGGTRIIVPFNGSANTICDGLNFYHTTGVVRTQFGSKVDGNFFVTGTTDLNGLNALSTYVNGALSVSGNTEIDGSITGAANATLIGSLNAAAVNSSTDVNATSGAINGGSLAISGSGGIGEQLTVGHRIHVYGGVDAFGPGDSEAWIHLDTTSLSASCWLYLTTNQTLRWVLGKNLATEAGSNLGSDFVISRFADDGSALGDSIIIHRDSGHIILPNLPTSTSGLTAGTLWIDGDTLKVA